ncbi:hypothetical protein KI387_010314, partial [Taxus chinensis]
METSPHQKNAQAPPNNNRAKLRPRYKGISLRKWGKWVSEVRMPKCRSKIWLGSYDTAEQAARAFDAAIYCLRGPNANFNFPNSIPAIPSASSLSPHQIRLAAAKHALDQIPCITINNNNNSELTEEAPSTSSVSETEMSSDGRLISEDDESSFWESLFADLEGRQLLDLEESLSFDA